MQDLSLHLLDIVENSIRANASLIKININEAVTENKFIMRIEDNGKGMDKAFLQKVTDPFMTTRTTRKIGLGLSLLKQNCELSGGTLEITSKLGKGTSVTAMMVYDNIDRLPLGDMASSLSVLIQANPQIDLIYTHQYEQKVFTLNTIELKETLEGVPINELEIIQWIKEYITENLQEIRSNLDDKEE